METEIPLINNNAKKRTQIHDDDDEGRRVEKWKTREH